MLHDSSVRVGLVGWHVWQVCCSHIFRDILACNTPARQTEVLPNSAKVDLLGIPSHCKTENGQTNCTGNACPCNSKTKWQKELHKKGGISTFSIWWTLRLLSLQGFLGVLAIHIGSIAVVIYNVARSKMAVTSYCIQVIHSRHDCNINLWVTFYYIQANHSWHDYDKTCESHLTAFR